MYVSSNGMSSALRAATMSTQNQLSTVQTELSSGTYADLGATLGSSSGRLISLSQENSRLAAYTASNALVTTRLDTTASTLKNLQSTATSFITDLTSASSSGGLESTIETGAANNLEATVSALNTTVGTEAIFGGINSATAPVSDYTATSAAKTAVDAAFQSAFGTSQTSSAASSITADQMTSFLNGAFSDLFSDSSFGSTWSTASDTGQTSTIAAGQTITSSVSANAEPLRQLTEAYTMVQEFTTSSGLSTAAQQAVTTFAANLLTNATTGLTNLQSQIGQAQNQVTAANTQITAQTSVLTTETSGLHDVDAYSLDTKLNSLQTQVQASYELTSQLKSLSLTTYLS